MGQAVARYLALWMTYEDAVRVADLKTRASRFERIRASQRQDAELVVTDFLKPDLDEIWGVLPHRLVAPFARWAQRRWPHGRPTLGQHVRTTTITGFLRVRMLTWLRPLRPMSWRSHEEHGRMARWLAGVSAAAARDEALACEIAGLAQVIKGYGDVRRRLLGVFDLALAASLRAADADVSFAAALASRLRALVLEGPDGESRAEALAAAAGDRLAAEDLPGARALLPA